MNTAIAAILLAIATTASPDAVLAASRPGIIAGPVIDNHEAAPKAKPQAESGLKSAEGKAPSVAGKERQSAGDVEVDETADNPKASPTPADKRKAPEASRRAEQRKAKAQVFQADEQTSKTKPGLALKAIPPSE